MVNITTTIPSAAANESVLTCRPTDPDCLKLSKTRFEINKVYMDIVQKVLTT